MNYFQQLPVELIQKVFNYLTGEEIKHCSKVCVKWKEVIEDDIFWKRVCLYKGFSRSEKEEFCKLTRKSSWRDYFWCIENWVNKCYKLHKIDDDYCILELAQVCGTNLIVPHRDNVIIWNIESEPFIEQIILVQSCTWSIDLKVCGEFMVYINDAIVYVYKKSDSYELERIISFKKPLTCIRSGVALEDIYEEYYDIDVFIGNEKNFTAPEKAFKFSVSIDDDKLLISKDEVAFVWCLKTWSCYIVLAPDGKCVYKMHMSWPRLYFVMEISNKYVVKVYDVPSDSLLFDLRLCRSQCKWMLPQVFTSDKYIVTSSTSGLINNSMVLVNLWNTKDGSHVNCIEVRGITFKPFFMDNIVILSSSCSVLLWDPIKDTVEVAIHLENKEFMVLNLLPNKLFVVSYSTYFEVWDLHTCSQLYKTSDTFSVSYCQKQNLLYYIQPVRNWHAAKENCFLIFNFMEPDDSKDSSFD